MATMYPQRARRHSPTAAAAQDAEAANSSATAQRPIRRRPSCPRGFTRHIGSRKPPGTTSDTPAVKLIRAPVMKKILSAVIPPGRWDLPDTFSQAKEILLGHISNGPGKVSQCGKPADLFQVPEEIDFLDSHHRHACRRTDDQNASSRSR